MLSTRIFFDVFLILKITYWANEITLIVKAVKRHHDTQHNDPQYKGTQQMTLSVMADHCYDECSICCVSLVQSVTCKSFMFIVIMMSVIMLSVIMLSVIMLSVIMLYVVMLSIIMLYVLMQSVI